MTNCFSSYRDNFPVQQLQPIPDSRNCWLNLVAAWPGMHVKLWTIRRMKSKLPVSRVIIDLGGKRVRQQQGTALNIKKLVGSVVGKFLNKLIMVYWISVCACACVCYWCQVKRNYLDELQVRKVFAHYTTVRLVISRVCSILYSIIYAVYRHD